MLDVNRALEDFGHILLSECSFPIQILYSNWGKDRPARKR